MHNAAESAAALSLQLCLVLVLEHVLCGSELEMLSQAIYLGGGCSCVDISQSIIHLA
jgi:hypothetical protein